MNLQHGPGCPEPSWQLALSPSGGYLNFVVCRNCCLVVDYVAWDTARNRAQMANPTPSTSNGSDE